MSILNLNGISLWSFQLFTAVKSQYIACNVFVMVNKGQKQRQRPGPEVIKLFSCSTQLSMKFQLHINTKIARNKGNFVLKLAEHAIYPAHKC